MCMFKYIFRYAYTYTYRYTYIYKGTYIHIDTHAILPTNKTREFLCDETRYYQLLTSSADI